MITPVLIETKLQAQLYTKENILSPTSMIAITTAKYWETSRCSQTTNYSTPFQDIPQRATKVGESTARLITSVCNIWWDVERTHYNYRGLLFPNTSFVHLRSFEEETHSRAYFVQIPRAVVGWYTLKRFTIGFSLFLCLSCVPVPWDRVAVLCSYSAPNCHCSTHDVNLMQMVY